MEHFIGHGLSVFMGFFAIMNPIANTLFLGLTADDDLATRRKVARMALRRARDQAAHAEP